MATVNRCLSHKYSPSRKARLHVSARLINTVESIKLNSTVELYCLHGSAKVNEAVDFKMAANELVREGVVVICDYLIKECQHILEKRNERKKRRWWVKPWIMRRNTLGASNTLLVEWTSEDRDMFKNHLRMSREQFFRIIIKSKTIHRERRHKHEIMHICSCEF